MIRALTKSYALICALILGIALMSCSAPPGQDPPSDDNPISDPQGEELVYFWDFGDVSATPGVSPAHTDLADDTYRATLMVSNAAGISSEPATTMAITANLPPMPLAGRAASIRPGEEFRLRSVFSDPGVAGTPGTYTIDWGDGVTAEMGSTSDQSASIEASHAYSAAGRYLVRVTVQNKDDRAGSDSLMVWVVGPELEGPIVLVGAGDIAQCNRPHVERTAILLDQIDGIVITLGDNVYPTGTAESFENCYGPTWGRHRKRTWPSIGNHDYVQGSAAAYFDYWGARAGRRGEGYYSYDLGAWHIVVLNSEIAMARGSAQEKWLRADLAANALPCILAYWHRPLFFTGPAKKSTKKIKPLWDALYEAGADLVLNGHSHHYERFAPQTPAGTADPERGIRQLIVGTGGGGERSVIRAAPNSQSEVLNNEAYGVLALTLEGEGYSWEFIAAAGSDFTDTGMGQCH